MSLVIDPPDGRIPALIPEAQERAAARAALNRRITQGPEDRSLSERCILGFNAGPPITPGGYNQNVQIFQTPDHVVLLNEMVHTARIVPLDGRPHGTLRQWTGDSRGRWDGETLVVETTNFLRETSFRGSSANLHLVERARLLRQIPIPAIGQFAHQMLEYMTQGSSWLDDANSKQPGGAEQPSPPPPWTEGERGGILCWDRADVRRRSREGYAARSARGDSETASARHRRPCPCGCLPRPRNGVSRWPTTWEGVWRSHRQGRGGPQAASNAQEGRRQEGRQEAAPDRGQEAVGEEDDAEEEPGAAVTVLESPTQNRGAREEELLRVRAKLSELCPI